MAIYTEVLTYLNQEVKVLKQDNELTVIEYMTGNKCGKTTTVFTKTLKTKTVKERPTRTYEIIIVTNNAEDCFEIKTEKGFIDVLIQILDKQYKTLISTQEVIEDILVVDSGTSSVEYLKGYKKLTTTNEITTVPKILWQMILNNIELREKEIQKNKLKQGW